MRTFLRRIPVLPAIVFLATCLAGESVAKPDIISLSKTPLNLHWIERLDLDRLAEKNGRIFVLAGPEILRRLAGEGIPFLIETPFFAPADPVTNGLNAAGGLNGAFHSYKEVEEELQALQEAYPQIVRLFTLGTSHEGRNITAVKISDNVGFDEEEAEVLFLGCHHAREWISVETPLLLAKELAESYNLDPGVRALVDGSEIWIVPLVNPDGLEYTIHTYRYWRKNRRANDDGSFGVDLNRNYGFKWGVDDNGSSPLPNSDVYRGSAAFSEPETLAVRSLFLSRDFRAVVSYHSYSQVIIYPWGYTDLPTGRDDVLSAMASAMAAAIAAVNGRVYDYGRAASSMYTTNGDLTDWTFASKAIPSFTIELSPVDIFGGGFFNAESEIETVFRENLPAALLVVDRAVGSYRSAGKRPFPDDKGKTPTDPRGARMPLGHP